MTCVSDCFICCSGSGDCALACTDNGVVDGDGNARRRLQLAHRLTLHVNGNAECDITPTDAVWRLSLGAVESHVASIVFGPADMSNLGCGPFP